MVRGLDFTENVTTRFIGSMQLHWRASILHGQVENLTTLTQMAKNVRTCMLQTHGGVTQESGMTLHAICRRQTLQKALLRFARKSTLKVVIYFEEL